MQIDVWDERTGEHETVDSHDEAERIVEQRLGAPVAELDRRGLFGEQVYAKHDDELGIRVRPRWEWT